MTTALQTHMSGIVREALAIQPAKYFTPDLANIRSTEVILTGMDCKSVTNANSIFPVIGTDAFNPCGVIICYNKRSRTAALLHAPTPTGEHVKELVDTVRSNPADIVEVHIIGMPLMRRDNELLSAEEHNGSIMEYMQSVVAGVREMKNVRLKTFDVYDKAKPYAVAFDTRNQGKLIRGSNLTRTMEQADMDMENERGLMSDWYRISDHFDGTAPDQQRARGRY